MAGAMADPADVTSFSKALMIGEIHNIVEDQGVEASGQERFIPETFCTRAPRRVCSELRKIESNDDERMHSIAGLAYKRGAYGCALFED